ncbi:MAG: protein-glutamate O-methyltransferase CheR [Deltaproteobacteria bacterium]|nr:protein-glutamate O-methyltransferase CheR [Deltaproteobacteria bacterium]MBN2674559.1 protein-glutamate O-methyltransferase CheR [Deltaproteobacteria bacterium]
MKQSIFNKFRGIAYDKAGISLGEQKKELVIARVAKRQRALNITDAAKYLEYLESPNHEEELIHFLDAISTNFTHFMREKSHFELLEQEIDIWKKSGRSRYRIWCAASSSGEEPYSIAITVADAFQRNIPDVRILATDINTTVLKKASAGEYSGKAIDVFSKAQRLAYFTRLTERDAEDAVYRVKPEIRDLLVFKRLNLAQPPFPMKGPIDIVFCRNVMIYFDREVRQRLVSEIERLLAPGGLLMVGHSETLAGLQTGMKAMRPSVYRKVI